MEAGAPALLEGDADRFDRVGVLDAQGESRTGPRAGDEFEGAGACVVLSEEREDVRAVGEQLAQVGDEFAGEVDLG